MNQNWQESQNLVPNEKMAAIKAEQAEESRQGQSNSMSLAQNFGLGSGANATNYHLTTSALDNTNLGNYHMAGTEHGHGGMPPHLDSALMMGEHLGLSDRAQNPDNPSNLIQNQESYSREFYDQYYNHMKESEYWQEALADPDEKFDKVSIYPHGGKKQMKSSKKHYKIKVLNFVKGKSKKPKSILLSKNKNSLTIKNNKRKMSRISKVNKIFKSKS